ncbi:hypothetical protein Bca4012_040606 [Brassica carinata]
MITLICSHVQGLDMAVMPPGNSFNSMSIAARCGELWERNSLLLGLPTPKTKNTILSTFMFSHKTSCV